METAAHLLPHRPPYRWVQVLRFLEGRAIQGIEAVQGDSHIPTALITLPGGGSVTGCVEVSNLAAENVLQVRLSDSLRPVSERVLSRLARQFDVANDPQVIAKQLRSMS